MKLKSLAKKLLCIAIFIAGATGLYFFEKNVIPKQVPRSNLPLRSIQFTSDGTVTKHWLARVLAIKKNTSISEIDIFALKKRLLEFSQIRDACVERRFPDSIAIKINERHPLLKFAVKSEKGRALLFVDSHDGSIFQAACMPKSLILATPYAELNLEKSKKSPLGIGEIRGIESVKCLIGALRSEHPEIYGQIRKFSLKKYDHRSGATWSRIEAFLKNGLVIEFSPRDIDTRLLRLDYLVHERSVMRGNVKKIDLTKVNSVIIENR
jgi:hypothetical protein